MSEKPATPAKGKDDLTPREIGVLAAAWQCMASQPEIDLNKLATLAGYTNPRSAGNMMAAIKKKLAALAEKNPEAQNGTFAAASTPSKAKAKATPAKKASGSALKRKHDADGDSNAGEENDASPPPAKKARTPRKKKSAAVVHQDDYDEEDAIDVQYRAEAKETADGAEEDTLKKENGDEMDAGEA